MTMTLISTTIVDSSAPSTITFLSIPQNYTDLMFIISPRTTGTRSNILYWMNSVRSGYSYKTLFGTGSTTSSSGSSSDTQALINDVVPGTSDTSNTFGNVQLYIPNYSGAANKSFSLDGVGENNGTSAVQGLAAGGVSSTAAITSMSFFISTGAWALNSTLSLYGVTKGSGGATVS